MRTPFATRSALDAQSERRDSGARLSGAPGGFWRSAPARSPERGGRQPLSPPSIVNVCEVIMALSSEAR